KEPINGKTAFFTEEVFRQFMGPEPSVEETVEKFTNSASRDADAIDTSGLEQSTSPSETPHPPPVVVSKLGPTSQTFNAAHNPAGRGTSQAPQQHPGGRGSLSGAHPPGVRHGQNKGRGAGRGKNFRFERPGHEVRKSSLSHAQQIRYVDLFKKYTQRFLGGYCQCPSERDLKEIMEFEKLQEMVAKEQEEFQAHLKRMAYSNPRSYTFLPQHVQKYTMEKQESCCKRAKSYARHYTNHSQIPMVVMPTDSNPAPLIFVQTLLEVGTKSKVAVPELKPNIKHFVRQEYDGVNARFPPQPLVRQDSTLWNHEPVSKDSNAEVLVSKHKCHVVTTANVISLLLNNHPPDFSLAWDIPVIIRQHEGSAFGKVVFLDKPLLPEGLSPSEKKTYYLQKELRTSMCQPLQQGKKTAQKGTDKVKPGLSTETSQQTNASRFGSAVSNDDDDDPFGASFTMDDLETFGSDKHSSFKKALSLKLEMPAELEKSLQDRESQPQTSPTTGESVVSLQTTKPDKLEDDTEKMQCDEPVDEGGTGASTNSDTHNLTEEHDNSPADILNEETSSNLTSNNTTAAPQQHVQVHPTTTPLKRRLRSSFKCDEDQTSDSDEDALCIVSQGSDDDDASPQNGPSVGGAPLPSQASGNVASSKSDAEMAVEVTEPTADKSSELPTRRVTRSASLRLKSSKEICTSKSSADAVCESVQASARRVEMKPRTQTATVEYDESPTPAKKLRGGDRKNYTGQTIGDGAQEKSAATADKVPQTATETGFSKGKQSTASGHAGSKCKSTPLDSILQLQKEMLPARDNTRLKVQEKAEDYRQPAQAGESVSYNLWDLAGISVLLRCSNHGFVRDFRQQQKPVYLIAKPERQLPHGLEQTTLNESVRAWLGCLLRPNSSLIRELQLNQILQPTLSFSVPAAFTLLKNIFTKLTELPVGSYLLSHEAAADHIQLRAATQNKSMTERRDKTVPWVPVDPTLILPLHWRLGLVPATFQPA
ncbi:hypothetical protein BaRGS_00020429, partial [Batillaria attramentaria]